MIILELSHKKRQKSLPRLILYRIDRSHLYTRIM